MAGAKKISCMPDLQKYTNIVFIVESRSRADQHSEGRYFAALEGGYNHSVPGKNVAAFLDGMDGGPQRKHLQAR